jgi:photosystem II stability/assembly factor-like uncharacterized protein
MLAGLLGLCLTGEARAHDKLDAHLLQALQPRCIGPANMSGRVTEIAVYEKRPSIMYVASASGGLWKTTNNGTTWTPVFERENTVALGAVAVAPTNPDIVWVGTGEANPRNSVSWGDGVYRSNDGGKSWKNMGLRDSHHIGRIVIHPHNHDVVYVAALGHLWGPNRERGLYKTVDGGQSWQQIKFIDDNTGFVDVAMDPSDPDTLYAAAYEVRRDAFSGGNPLEHFGPGSGLYRTSDGGKTWEKMTDGLPKRPLGRCGFSIYRNDPHIVYAVVQTDQTRTLFGGQAANLTESEDQDDKGETVKRAVTADDGGIFKSTDKGRTWTYLNSLVPRPFYYGQIRVDPNDANRVYVLGIVLNLSLDGGKTFLETTAAKDVHSDHHALWINPRDSNHLVLGNDGGVYFSYDRTQHWEHARNLPLAQFYAVGVDMRKPYRVYGGLQDNGTWAGPSATRNAAGILSSDWINILGFDGYYCQIDPKEPDIVYAEGQYGILRRINPPKGDAIDIKPRLEYRDKKEFIESNIRPAPPAGTPEFRFNWSSPILLSEHNNSTVYFGGNFLFRSTDRGQTWAIISPDLSRETPGPKANRGHTITTLAESPLKAGLLYAGTDDGRVHRTDNAGTTWLDLSDKVSQTPAARHISRVECSRFDEGTAYLAIDRHRNDDRAPYLFRTTDYGASWTSISTTLPAGGPVYVVREDPRNKDLLYVGTEFGLFVSLDGGASWLRHPGLPTVPVHDLVVHPRDRELVIGTHGRGIWIMDVRPLQDLTRDVLQREVVLLDVATATVHRPYTFRRPSPKTFLGENPPYGASIYFYLKKAPMEAPTIRITDARGRELMSVQGAKDAGLQRVGWRSQMPGTPSVAYRPVPPGGYTVTLHVGQRLLSKTVTVEVE